MTDTLPAHTTFVSASAGCTAAAGVITCPVAPLAGRRRRSIYTVIVRVDDDVPGGRSRQHRRRHGAGRHADRPTTTARRPRRWRFAGLGDFVWWDQNHDGLQTRRRARLRRRHRAPLQRLRSARGHDDDRRQRPLPLRQTAARDDLRRLPRRAGRQRRRRPARRLRADRRRTPAATTPIDSDAAPAQRRALHRRRRRRAPPARSSRPTTSASGSRPPSATGSGRTRNHNGIQDAGEHGVGGVGVALHDSTGATIAHAVTDANGLYLFDRLPPGHLQRVLRASRTIPVGLQPDHEGRERLHARRTARTPAPTAAPSAPCWRPGQRDLDWDAGIWKPSTPSERRLLGRGLRQAAGWRSRRSASPRRCAPASAIRYTLVVTNVGKATAHGVKVCDNLPDGLTVTSTGGGKLSGAQVCWTVGVLAQGQAQAVHAARQGRPDAALATSSTRPIATVERHAARPRGVLDRRSRSRAAATGVARRDRG